MARPAELLVRRVVPAFCVCLALFAPGTLGVVGHGVQVAEGNTSAILELDLSDLQYSNLQGRDPSIAGVPRGLRFRGVAWAEGTLLDLVAEAEDRYEPFNASENINTGMGQQMGRVNIKVGSHLELVFKLVRTGTDILQRVGDFHLTFILPDKRLELQVFEFADYCVSAKTQLAHDFSSSLKSLSLWSTAPSLSEQSLVNDSSSAQEEVKDRAVTFAFRNTASFGVIAYATGALEEAGVNLLFSGVASNPPWNCYRWSWADGISEGGLLLPPPARPSSGSRFDCGAGGGPLRFRAAAGGRRCADLGMEPILDRATCQAAARTLHLPLASPRAACEIGPPEGCSIEIGRSSISLRLSTGAGHSTALHGRRLLQPGLRRPLCKTQAWDDAKAKWCCKHEDIGCSEAEGSEGTDCPHRELLPRQVAVVTSTTTRSASSTEATSTTTTQRSYQATSTSLITAGSTVSSSTSSAATAATTLLSSRTSSTSSASAALTASSYSAAATQSTTLTASTITTSMVASNQSTTAFLDCNYLVEHLPELSEIRSWCCRNMAVGCDASGEANSTAAENSTTSTTSTVSLELCRGLPAGQRRARSAEEQRWCCEVWGIGCESSEREPLNSSTSARPGASTERRGGRGKGLEDCSQQQNGSESLGASAEKTPCRTARPEQLFARRPALSGLPAGASLAPAAAAGALACASFAFFATRWGRRPPASAAYTALPAEEHPWPE